MRFPVEELGERAGRLWSGELGARRGAGSLWVTAHFMLCFEAF